MDSYRLILGSLWADLDFCLTPMAPDRPMIGAPVLQDSRWFQPSKGLPFLLALQCQELYGELFKCNHGSEIKWPGVETRSTHIICEKRRR